MQRGSPMPVWGTAGAGEGVSVAFAGRRADVCADASGRWLATLPAPGAGGPFSLEVRTGSGAALAVVGGMTPEGGRADADPRSKSTTISIAEALVCRAR
jgi:hypothetical protein